MSLTTSPNKLLAYQVKIQQGFTLIELIIGIVVLSVSLSIVSTLIVPAEEKSADNILQIKASELAQSLMTDILSRAFDDNSDMSGGRIRCGEPAANACTLSSELGPETGEAGNRNLFDDVDDFHGYNELINASNDTLDGGYNQFTVNVTVIYAGDDLGLANNLLAKRITVTVTTPLGTAIAFTSYKANF